MHENIQKGFSAAHEDGANPAQSASRMVEALSARHGDFCKVKCSSALVNADAACKEIQAAAGIFVNRDFLIATLTQARGEFLHVYQPKVCTPLVSALSEAGRLTGEVGGETGETLFLKSTKKGVVFRAGSDHSATEAAYFKL